MLSRDFRAFAQELWLPVMPHAGAGRTRRGLIHTYWVAQIREHKKTVKVKG
jgi:hypothetical protein